MILTLSRLLRLNGLVVKADILADITNSNINYHAYACLIRSGIIVLSEVVAVATHSFQTFFPASSHR